MADSQRRMLTIQLTKTLGHNRTSLCLSFTYELLIFPFQSEESNRRCSRCCCLGVQCCHVSGDYHCKYGFNDSYDYRFGFCYYALSPQIVDLVEGLMTHTSNHLHRRHFRELCSFITLSCII
ncbi:hypothetical protein KSS87_006011 [Heliosperma pusillum]|nr:hypothetical protein KSS87_006011 [Heliosperma pusillum]